MKRSSNKSTTQTASQKRKKRLFATLALVVLGCILSLICFLIYFNHTYLNRYEWARLCTEQYAITLTAESESYYDDVPKNNKYYSDVMAYYYAGGASKDRIYNGTEKIRRKEAVLSSMRIVFNGFGAADYTDEDLLILAAEHGISTKSSGYLTEKEAMDLLLSVSSLYLNNDILEDHHEIIYAPDTVIIESVSEYLDSSYLQIVTETCNFTVGDKVVFPDAYDEMIVARKVEYIREENGRYIITFSEIDMDEVITEYNIRQSIEYGYDELYEYYSRHGWIIDANGNNYEIQPTARIERSYKGFSISFRSPDEFPDCAPIVGYPYTVAAVVTDKETGESFVTRIPSYESMDGFSISFGMENAKIIAEVSKIGPFIDYALCDISYELTTDMGLYVSDSASFDIPVIPNIPIGGICGLSCDLNLCVEGTGEIRFETRAPIHFGFEQTGFTFRPIITPNESTIQVASTLSGNLSVGPKISLKTANSSSIISSTLLFGADINVETTIRDVHLSCTDMDILFPTLRIKTESGELISPLISFEHNYIILGNNHKKMYDDLNEKLLRRKQFHVEMLNNNLSLVDYCTYEMLSKKQANTDSSVNTKQPDFGKYHSNVSSNYEFDVSTQKFIDYINEELIPTYGYIEPNNYSTNTMNGILTCAELDLDLDNQTELLSLRQTYENNALQLTLQVYEYEKSRVVPKASYSMDPVSGERMYLNLSTAETKKYRYLFWGDSEQNILTDGTSTQYTDVLYYDGSNLKTACDRLLMVGPGEGFSDYQYDNIYFLKASGILHSLGMINSAGDWQLNGADDLYSLYTISGERNYRTAGEIDYSYVNNHLSPYYYYSKFDSHSDFRVHMKGDYDTEYLYNNYGHFTDMDFHNMASQLQQYYSVGTNTLIPLENSFHYDNNGNLVLSLYLEEYDRTLKVTIDTATGILTVN